MAENVDEADEAPDEADDTFKKSEIAWWGFPACSNLLMTHFCHEIVLQTLFFRAEA